MNQPIQSAGGIVYYIDKNESIPRFLVIKRFALSKKIEWVAPKGKIQHGENPQKAAIREISEETGLSEDNLSIKKEIGKVNLSLYDKNKGGLEKEIVYFLVEYSGKSNAVSIPEIEGYLGFYKWANIQEVLGLIYYENLREIFRNAYNIIVNNGFKS